MRRPTTVAALVTAALLTAASPAFADPGSGYVSGHEGAGRVTARSTSPAGSCATRRALVVIDYVDPEFANGAQRGDSAPGQGWVCVSKAAYTDMPIGSWWSGRASGPRG